MRAITLTQGKTAIVDDADYERLSAYKWYVYKRGCFYAWRHSKENHNVLILMHHEIIGKPPLGMVTDHIDGDGLNNQRHNLRHVTHRQNIQNYHKKKSSIYPGVTYHKKSKKWMSQIQIQGKRIYLGMHSIELEAYKAYLDAERKFA